MTFFCDHNTKEVYTNNTDYYYCTQNSSSDTWSGKQRLELLLFYTWCKVVGWPQTVHAHKIVAVIARAVSEG